jgi:hypothetical protein
MSNPSSKDESVSEDIFNGSQYDDVNDSTRKAANFQEVDMFQVTLKLLKKDFQEGNKFSLMTAIYECAENQVSMPEWVAKAYILAFTDIHSVKFKSWDDVFDKPFKRQNTGHIKTMQKYSTKVISKLREMKKNGESLNEETFEAVGKTFGFSKDLVKKMWRSRVNEFE